MSIIHIPCGQFICKSILPGYTNDHVISTIFPWYTRKVLGRVLGCELGTGVLSALTETILRKVLGIPMSPSLTNSARGSYEYGK
jgi:hypothetical protein